MAGVRALRKIQMGRESTAGNAVVATTIWRGRGVADDQTKVVFPEEDVGVLISMDRTYIPEVGGGLAMDAIPATYEQMMHIFEAGIKAATPTTDGSGYVRAYTFPTTAQNTIKTYTIESGDDQQAEEMAYCYVESFKLSGKGNEAVMLSAVWKGRQLSTTAFTTGITLVEVEEVIFNKGLLYINAPGETIGSTLKSSTFLAMDLDVKTGWVAVATGDGELYFTFIKNTALDIKLDVTFEHDGVATAEKAAWRAQTPRLIRMKWTGAALSSAGATYTYKTLVMDLAGKWEKFDKLGEQAGNDIVKGTFRGRYNTTSALTGEITVVNEVASVP